MYTIETLYQISINCLLAYIISFFFRVAKPKHEAWHASVLHTIIYAYIYTDRDKVT